MAALGLAAAIALAPALAEARAGLGSSSGSRGSRTSSAPAVTNTAPRTAQPIERSATPQSQPGVNANRPPIGQPSPGGFFGGALGRGLLGGLIGAGLFGMLFGHGFGGGLGSMMSFLGLIIQLGLLFLVVRWAINRFSNRQPAAATAGAPNSARSALGGLGGFGGLGGGSASGAGATYAQQTATGPLTVQGEDYASFEKLLADVQHAFADENVERLRQLATPEMVSYFAQDIADLVRKGHATRVSGVKLVTGDLSEAWREESSDYATVAMRYSLVDATIDRVTNKVVSGDVDGPQEVTEIWTFVRPTGAAARDWKVSAIQQA